MPFETELTDDYMGIIHVGRGLVTGEQIAEGCRAVTVLVQTTENFHYKLVDLSEVTELKMTEEELDRIVEEDRQIAAVRPRIAVGIIAPNEKLRAIAQRWERSVEELGWNTYIAPTRTDALKWLRENAAAPVAI
jgi:hypothetical protein